MKTIIQLAFAGALGLGLSGAAHAQLVLTDANDPALGVALTPPFGTLVDDVGAAAIDYGLDFSYGNVEGIFSDPPNAFGGVNADGVLDLLTDVDARIVVLGTTTQGLTNYLYVEAGFAEDGALTLVALGLDLSVLATAPITSPTGVYGRFTALITRPTFDIAYFTITGEDTYGVNQIVIETPRGIIPEPATWGLMIAGFGLVGAAMRRRSAALAA